MSEKKFYKIILSQRDASFVVDEIDLEKIYREIGSGKLIKCKGGIFNPSFLVSIVPTTLEGKRIFEGENVYLEEAGKDVFRVTRDELVAPELEDHFGVGGPKRIGEVMDHPQDDLKL